MMEWWVWKIGEMGRWGDGEMGEWVVGSEAVGRSLLERSLVISPTSALFLKKFKKNSDF
jgi:hypothetical protein